MQQENKPLDPRVFDMAGNLFGFRDRRNEIVELPQAIERDESRINAVWPVLSQEAFALTMDRYRVYVALYNFRTNAENEQIDRFNKAVRTFTRSGATDATTAKLVEMFLHRTARGQYPLARDYNAQVAEFCDKHGPLVAKRRIPTVKAASELVFQNFLYLYGCQLKKRTDQYIRLQVHTPRPIQELSINADLVTKLKRNEVASLALCKKTVRNHRQRLQECGVLADYHFAGSRMAVTTHIHPEILHVFDIKTSKIATAENQRVNPSDGKELPDTNDCTGTTLKEYQRKGNVDSSRDKVFAPLMPKSICFLREHPEQGSDSRMGPAPPGVKISETMPQLAHPQRRAARPMSVGELLGAADQAQPAAAVPAGKPETLSDRLRSLLMHPQDLAVRLAGGEYFHYTPIDIRLLAREAYNGTMGREEFRELVIQDFFKSAAKLYRNSTPYVGSWKNALNLYYENKFLSWQGEPFNKYTIVPDITELRYRLEWARKWFARNPEVRPLFPSSYFDLTRKTQREIGFEFTRSKWQEHEKYERGRELRRSKAQRKAQLRARNNSEFRKAQVEIRRFYRNKITLPQLLEYVERNLPSEFMEKLPQLLQNESLRINLKGK